MMKKSPTQTDQKQDKNPVYYQKLMRFCQQLDSLGITPRDYDHLRLFIWNMNFFRDQVQQQGHSLATQKLGQALVHLNHLETQLSEDSTKHNAVALVKQYEPELVKLSKQFAKKIAQDNNDCKQAPKKLSM